jgi:hypothetical protein
MRNVVAVPLLSLALAGCDRLLGIEDLPYAQTDVDAAVDAPLPRKAACDQCAGAASACAAQVAACSGDCAETWDCIVRCPVSDPVCRRTCEKAHPSWATDPAYLALDACARRVCVGQCYGTAGLFKAVDTTCGCADTACLQNVSQCVQSDLPSATDAGASTAKGPAGNCERRMACIAEDANPDHYLECAAAFPTDQDLTKLLNCARAAGVCTGKDDKCPLPKGELACLGFGFHRTTDATKQVTILVSDINDIYPGATVTACKPGNCGPDCEPVANAGGVATVGASGKATVTVPIPGAASPGGGGYTGCLKVAAPVSADLLPTMFDSGRLIHVDEDEVATYLFGAGSLTALAPASVTPDVKNAAHIIGAVHDCLWGPIVGATVEIDVPGVRVWYIGDELVEESWTVTGPKGAFGVFNVPPGDHTLTVKVGTTVIDTHPIQVKAAMTLDANIFPQGRK